MILTRGHVWTALIVSVAAYVITGWIWPEEAKSSVNALLFFLSTISAMMLVPDIIDLVRSRGAGLSWQAATAKGGLFLLFTFFAAGRLYAFIYGLLGSPDYLSKSATAGYFSLGQGIAMAMVFFAFNSAAELQPRLNIKSSGVLLVALGVVIGLALGGYLR